MVDMIDTSDYSGDELPPSEDFAPEMKDSKPVMTNEVASDLAGQAALLQGGSDPASSYDVVKEELLRNGESQGVDEVHTALGQNHQQLVAETAAQLAYDMSGRVDPHNLYEVAHTRVRDFEPNMATAISENSADTNQPATKTAKAVFDNWMETKADDDIDYLATLQSKLDEVQDDIGLDWETAGGMIASFGPFYENALMFKLGQEFLGGGKKGLIAPGEVLEEMQHMVAKLPPPEKIEMFDTINEYLKENAGLVFGGNDFMRVNTMISLFNDEVANSDPMDVDWDRWMMDLGGAMEAAMFLVPAAAGINRVFKASRANSTFQRIVDTNPTKAGELAVTLLKDQAKLEAIGETVDSLTAKYVLPKDATWKTASTPEQVREAFLGADRQLDEVFEASSRVDAYVGQEGIALAEDMRTALKNVNGGNVRVADTALWQTNKGWKVRAVIADSEEGGWDTLEAAQEANKNMFDGKGTVVSRAGKGDELSEGTENPTEFFINVENESDVVFTDDNYGIVINKSLGWARSSVTDPDTQFAASITHKGNAVFDQYKLMEKGLESKFVPLSKLNNSGRLFVSKILSRGLQQERAYSPKVIRRLAKGGGFSDAEANKLVNAYKEARKGFDAMFLLENQIHTKSLVKEGFNATLRVGDETIDFAKPLSQASASDVKRVYNPRTKTVEDAPDLDKLYANGEELVELKSYVRVGGEQSKYVIRDSKAALDELPDITLSYREGWLPTRYQENYFLTEDYKVRENGALVAKTRVIGVAKSKAQVELWAANKNKDASEGVTYNWKHDRQLDDRGDDYTAEINKANGKLFFSKRGDRLKHEDGSFATIQDPLESAINSIRTVAKRTAMDDFTSELKAKYVNTYGHLTGGEFRPAVAVDGKITSKQLDKADAMFKHINNIEQVGGSPLNEKMHLIRTAEWLDDLNIKGSSQLAQGVRHVAGTEFVGQGVVSWVRGVNFNLNLGTDPFRQMILQPTQLLMMSALDPLGAPRNINNGRILSKMAADRNYEGFLKATDAELDTIAKLNLMEMDGKELRKMVTEFRESGLGQAVTSHQQARDAATQIKVSTDKGFVSKAASGVMAPIRGALGGFDVAGKRVPGLRQGFERGEEINLGGHYVIARKRWMEQNPGKDPSDHLLEIGGMARGLSLSMTGVGDLAYSNGIASVPMQYFAIRHKSLMALTTNQNFTKSEKIRMAAGQLAMWGPEGLGLGFVANSMATEMGIQLPSWFEDGMMESGINGALSVVSGEDVDLDWAGSFSLLGGVLDENIVAEIGKMFIDGSGDVSRLAFGASKSNFNRLGNLGNSMMILGNTLSGSDSEGNLDPNRLDYRSLMAGITADDFLSIASSYNRMAQAKMMVKSGYWSDTVGRDILPATALEAGFKGFLGLSSNKVEALRTLQEATTPKSQFGTDELRETVDDYYRIALRITKDSLDSLEAGTPYEEALTRNQALLAANNIMIANLGPDADEAMDMLRKKMANNVGKNKKDELLDKITKFNAYKPDLNPVEFAKQQGLMSEQEYENYITLYNRFWEPKS